MKEFVFKSKTQKIPGNFKKSWEEKKSEKNSREGIIHFKWENFSDLLIKKGNSRTLKWKKCLWAWMIPE